MARFPKGTTIRISAEIADYNDTLMDPDTSIKVSVEKDGTSILAATAMSQLDAIVGKYYYRWQSTTAMVVGKYESKITVVHNARTSINHDERAFYLY